MHSTGCICLLVVISPAVSDRLRKGRPLLFGYARVSRGEDQSTAAQRRLLREAGAEKVYEEAASGGRWDRPELARLLDQLRPGDVVMVWKLDRLSRSLKDLLHRYCWRIRRGKTFAGKSARFMMPIRTKTGLWSCLSQPKSEA